MGEGDPLDLYERLTARAARWRAAHPSLVARLRAAGCIASWAALLAGLLALLLVPSTRRGLVVVVTVQYVLLQLWLLSRSKTIRWRSVARALTVGTLVAPLIGLADVAVMAPFGWTADDPVALVWVAGPVEEALKVAPLLVALRVASQRSRRLALVDFALFGMALGAGFQLVEDLIRRVTAGRPGLFAVLLGDGSTQFRVLALFPGWQEDASAFFPGHFLLTALIALGIGWAHRLRPRLGQRAVLLPVGLYVLAALDHSLYNFHVTGGSGPVPRWLEGLHRLWGAGREVRPLFVLLLLLAVVADYGVVESVRARLPALPGRSPAAGLIAAAERSAHRLPDDAVPAVRQLVGALPAAASAASSALHEGLVTLAAARAGPQHWVDALDFLRQRRKLAFALRVAPADPLRVEPVVPGVRASAARLAHVVLPAVALLSLLWLVRSGDGADPAFLANLFDELGRWWNALPLWQQALVIGGAVALLMLGGASWAFALGAAGLAADAASRGQGIATLLRNPRRAIGDFFRTLTPADVLIYAVGAGLSRIVPSGVSRMLGESAEEAAERAAREAAAAASASRLVPGGGLAAHEALGGHTLRRHLGQTAEQLRARLDDTNLAAVSTFTDRTVAEEAIAEAIDAHDADIARWLETATLRLELDHVHGEPVGVTLLRGAEAPVPTEGLRVVLRRDPSSPLGYHIRTSFPQLPPSGP